MFAPILIYTIIEQVFLKNFNWQKFKKDLIGGLAAIVVMFGLAAPFGLGKVISQYVDTMGSYEYCSINAYNFWAMLGKTGPVRTTVFWESNTAHMAVLPLWQR